MRSGSTAAGFLLGGISLLFLLLPAAWGQGETPAASGAPAGMEAPANAGPWSLHAQATLIEQWHYGFPSSYEGPNSFPAAQDEERTFSSTFYLGRQLWPGAAVYYNPEILQGHGLGQTVGIAGFPNGEGVKAAFYQLHYNTSRLYVQQVFGLGGETEKVDDDQNQLAGIRDVNRLSISVGKFAASDFFDDNAYDHDTRSQFLNWASWESAAWDYPADVLGYTCGTVVELNTKDWAVHYGLLMEPTEANGPTLDTHLYKAWGQILQWDRRYAWRGRGGTLRLFAYWNHARMGEYEETLALSDGPMDVTRTREYRSKVGAGLSWDQELTQDLGVFARLSWNDGRTETFAFTEVDRSLVSGLSLKGGAWGRPDDTIGLAGVFNGLSAGHRAYLAAGGLGMILGDGALSYAPEEIGEAYYSVRIRKWLWFTPDYQYVEHPGYNTARGGLSVYGIRAHVQF